MVAQAGSLMAWRVAVWPKQAIAGWTS